jgi:hypothetical protein
MISRADLPYARAHAHLKDVGGFAGLGFGLRETAGRITPELAWRVYVTLKQARRSLSWRERVPARLFDLPTDVIEAAATHCAAGDRGRPGSAESRDVSIEGAAIANHRGVPGSLGCIAWLLRTDEPVLLSSYHVLFGKRCQRGDPIWSVEATPRLIGRVLSGKAGIVVGLDPPTFVDAATGTPADSGAATGSAPLDAAARADAGDLVSKRGAATGRTQGVVVDIAYPDHWYWEYQSANAPRQILVRSTAPGDRPFSRTGDSGAVVRNERGELLGLLWGTTARGEGVASPINAVARALGLRFANTSAGAVS